jgi:hypothetical protein
MYNTLLRPEEVAGISHISQRRVYQLCEDGTLQQVKVGSFIISWKDLEASQVTMQDWIVSDPRHSSYTLPAENGEFSLKVSDDVFKKGK